MKISNALINSLAEEQSIESVRPEDELRYSNYFADSIHHDLFLEDDKIEVQNNLSKAEKARQRKAKTV